jgi:hypothetical protein
MDPAKNKVTSILLLTGFRIFPTNTGGHLRTGSIARALARQGYGVRIYSLAGRQEDYSWSQLGARAPHLIAELEPNLIEETHLGLDFGLMQAASRRLDFPRYWQHQMLRRGIVPARLRSALQQADIILSDTPWCPPVPGPWSGKPWYLLSHNLEYRLLEQAPPRHRRFARWMRQMEENAPRQFRDIFACAEEDQRFFRQHDPTGRLRLPIVRCGVDPAVYRTPVGTRERVRAELGLSDEDTLLIFSGSRFAPNIEALASLREFCRTEADFLQRERVHLLVLGSILAAPERAGALIGTGRVPAIEPYLAAGDAGLNAVTRGSGANVKLFEYLAARLPIISTPFGVRGTALEPEKDFLAYEPHQLRGIIERFKRSRTREEWSAHANAVWDRHRHSCDIQLLVNDAIAELPEFNYIPWPEMSGQARGA